MTISARRDAYLRQLGRRSAHTPVAFGTGLTRFCNFVEERFGLGPEAPACGLKIAHVLAFAEALLDAVPPLAAASRANYVIAVRRFYRHLVRERVLALDATDLENLGEALRQMNQRRKALTRPAPVEAVDALIAAAQVADAKRDVPAKAPPGDRNRADLRRLRNAALIRALYSSGMRIGEALALVRGDLDSVQHSARVVGKNNRERIVYFSEDAWTALAAYFGARGDGEYRGLGELPVFAQHYRGAGKRLKRLTRQRVEQMFAEWRQLSGIEEHVTPRRLRL